MTDDIREDLAYVKALAEEGRDTPLVNGVTYVIWGGLIGLTALIVYADAIGWIDLGPTAGYAPWIAAFVIGWASSLFFGRRAGAKPGASTIGNRTASAVWLGVGLFMTGFWLTLMIVHDNFTAAGVPPYFLFNLMFPIGFGVYGIAFFATAAAGRLPWLRTFAFVSWGCSISALFLMASPHMLLVAAFGSFVCVLAPGLIFMRGEPSEIV